MKSDFVNKNYTSHKRDEQVDYLKSGLTILASMIADSIVSKHTSSVEGGKSHYNHRERGTDARRKRAYLDENLY